MTQKIFRKEHNKKVTDETKDEDAMVEVESVDMMLLMQGLLSSKCFRKFT